MADLACPISRRRFCCGAVAALATTVPRRGHGQPAAADGWQTLRARPGEPGPTLRLKAGDELRVRLINEMDAATALHWHGVRVPNAMDGVPGLTQEPVRPGASFDYRFTPPDAGTFWYRPAVAADGQRLRGPHGALIVTESEPAGADRDVLVFVEELSAPDSTPVRDIPVRANERLRLRVVNALVEAVLPLRFENHAVWVMAIDGQPAEPFQARDGEVTLGPGNRMDLFIDATLAAGESALVRAHGAPFARLLYERSEPWRPAQLAEPKPLAGNRLPERFDFRNAQRLELPLESTPPASGARPLFTARRGRTVVLALANRTEAAQAVHLHGHAVRLLDRLDDGWKPFWLDTVMVAPRQTERIAFVADNPGKWQIECRVLGRAANEKAVWFTVT
ncbi:MAG: hypothetical protein QOC56_470 [Alphaproteobacteria bacterium]|jgi:FtsP/CotA-like multicopper oxidase with cupredoxin domain|nr:hypothetical protein [Alphaproteobacteria bacterium]